MKHTIKNRWTGAIIAESDDGTLAEFAVANKADLRGADLREADLRGADLLGADLRGADLLGADLRGADLSRANLSEADLSGADLSRANLSRANLSEADLSGADLSGANLSRADLPPGVHIVQVSGIGSARRITTYRIDTDEVWCGCFRGTLKEFRARVTEQYLGGKHRAEYDAAIAFFKACRDAPGEAKP